MTHENEKNFNNLSYLSFPFLSTRILVQPEFVLVCRKFIYEIIIIVICASTSTSLCIYRHYSQEMRLIVFETIFKLFYRQRDYNPRIINTCSVLQRTVEQFHFNLVIPMYLFISDDFILMAKLLSRSLLKLRRSPLRQKTCSLFSKYAKD